MNKAHRLKINLFGDGETLMRIMPTKEQERHFQQLAARMQLDLPQALADPFFYHRLGKRGINSAADLKYETNYRGLCDTPKNQLEIWYGGRKVLKIKLAELLNDMVLFPLYRVTVSKTESGVAPGYYIRRMETGLIAVFETVAESFRIEDVEFRMRQTPEFRILAAISHRGQEMKSKRSDTVETSSVGYFAEMTNETIL